MKKKHVMTLAASGLILLSCQQSGGNTTGKDSTHQTASEAPAGTAAVKYVKKFVRTLTDDEPEVMLFSYDAKHRITAIHKEGEEGVEQEFGYDGNGNLNKLSYRNNNRRHVILYTHAGSQVTGIEKVYEEDDASGDPISEYTWTIEMSNGKAVKIKKENKEEPSENSLQLYTYEGENVKTVTSMAPNGKDQAGTAEMTYGKKSSPFAGARLPILHPTALLLLQPLNDMTSLKFHNKLANASIVMEYEYKYDTQGYPVSVVEKSGGEVSATSTYEYK